MAQANRQRIIAAQNMHKAMMMALHQESIAHATTAVAVRLLQGYQVESLEVHRSLRTLCQPTRC